MNSSPLYLAIVVVWLIVLVPMLLRRDSAVQYEDGADLDADPDADFDADADSDADDGGAPGAGEPDDGEWAGADAADADGYDGADEPRGTRDRHAVPGGPPFRGRAVSERRAEPEPADPDRTQGLAHEDVGESRGGADDGAEDMETATASAPLPPLPRPSRAKVIARRRRRTSGLTALFVLTGIGVGAGLGPWWVLVPPTVLLLGHLALLREAAKADSERRAAEARRRRRVAQLRRAREAEEKAAREAQVIELMERRNQVYDQYADAHLRAAGD